MRESIATFLCIILAFPASAQMPIGGSDMIASPNMLNQSLRDAALEHGQNLQQLTRFFKTPAVRGILNQARLDPDELIQRASLLSSDELARLAARSRDAERDIAAGGVIKAVVITLVIVGIALAVLAIIGSQLDS